MYAFWLIFWSGRLLLIRRVIQSGAQIVIGKRNSILLTFHQVPIMMEIECYLPIPFARDSWWSLQKAIPILHYFGLINYFPRCHRYFIHKTESLHLCGMRPGCHANWPSAIHWVMNTLRASRFTESNYSRSVDIKV